MTTRLWCAAALCLVVSLTPWGPLLLYPFTLFTTWVHESGHAAAAVLLGGRVASITIQPDTSGLTRSLMPASTLAQALVASAGYLTASIVGCLLLVASRDDRRTKSILWTIGALMLITIVLWIRNLFGAVVVAGWALALFGLAGKRATRGVAGFAMSVLAIQVSLNAVFDIRTLFLVRGASDAATMQRLTGAPAWWWAAVWMAASLALLAATLRATRSGR
ncbi:MAG TPA: M50 family metallopeptidase [Vicinamibacterales bacterium]